MATVPVARSTETLQALPGQRQQVQRQDSGLGEGLQSLGQGLQQFAKGRQIYLDKVDEATVADLDSSFANDVRGIERSFTSAQGKNAVDIAADTQKAWAETRASYLSRANNPTQAALLNKVLDQRATRWSGQYDTHLTTQANVWQTSAFEGRVATMSVDVADLPVGSVERAEATLALGAVVNDFVAMKGLAPEAAQAKRQEIFSSIHENTVAQFLAAGDPESAETYYTDFESQIDPRKRAGLRDKVTDSLFGKETFETIAGLPDRSPATARTVTPPSGAPITLHPPVAGSTLRGSFGEQRPNHTHAGVDLAVPVNTPVVASAAGTIRWLNDPDGYGRYAVIDHGNGLMTRYAHLSASKVEDGTRVDAGQIIALSGGAVGAPGSGNSRGPHVHYEVRRNGAAVDPTKEVSNAAAPAREGGQTDVAAQPLSLQGAYDEADRLAESRRPGDWRYRQRMRQAMTERYGQIRAVTEDRERQAGDALVEYFEGGSKAGQTPPTSILNAASPQQRLAFNRDRLAAASPDGVKTDENQYESLQRMKAQAPVDFARVDLTAYELSPTDRRRLTSDQNEIRTNPNAQTSPAVRAVQAAWSQVEAFYPEGFKEDIPRINRLRDHVTDRTRQYMATHNNELPPPDVVRGFGAEALRTVRRTEQVTGGFFDRRREVTGYAFEETGRTVVPRPARTEIITKLQREARAEGRRFEMPTDEEIAWLYRAQLSGGRAVPTAP